MCTLIGIVAEESPTVKKTDKTQYEVFTAEKIISDIKQNSHRAATFYKNRKVALIGKVDFVSSDGKKLYLCSDLPNYELICDVGAKNLSSDIDKLSAGNYVVLFGKVKSLNDDKLESTVSRIVTDVGTEDYNGGKACGMTLYPPEAITERSQGNMHFSVLNRWQSEETCIELKNNNEEVPGVIFDLGDNERVIIYCGKWNSIKSESEYTSNGGKQWWFYDAKRKTLNYFTGLMVPRRAEYKVSKELINSTKYDYYYGIKNDNDKQIKSEIYYYSDDINLYAIDYEYIDSPVHLDDVTLLLSTITFAK